MLHEPVNATEVLTPSEQSAGSPGLGLRLLALGLALAGGVLGILGAVVQEVQAAGGGLLLIFVGAPVIEEALKPAGIYILLLRWPHAAGSRLSLALLTALSGLVFGIIESFVYVTLYFSDASSELVTYRFTVPLLLHTSASFLVGLGLSRAIIDWAAGRASFPQRTRNFYIAAVILHAAYNTTVVALAFTGVWELE